MIALWQPRRILNLGLLLLLRWNHEDVGSTPMALASAFASSSSSSDTAATAMSSSAPDHNNLLPLSIVERPFSKFEQAEQARAFAEIKRSCQGCWSGSLSILGLQATNQVATRQAPVRNFRLQVQTQLKTGTWTVWNLQREGDEVMVPLRQTPLQRPSQYKIAFDGIILRIPFAISDALPRIVFEIGFWDDRSRRTAVTEYVPSKSWWSSRREGSWRLDETTLVQMKRQPKAGFVGPITDPCAIAFLPTRASFDLSDWDWQDWQPVASECVDFIAETRTQRRLDQRKEDDKENQKVVWNRIVQAFSLNDSSRFVKVLPNSILTSMPYRLNPDATESWRAFFCHAWNEKDLAVVEVEYQGRMAKSASLHCFQRRK